MNSIIFRSLFADINYLRDVAHSIETNNIQPNPNNHENNSKNADPDIFSRFFAEAAMNNNDNHRIDNPDTDLDENN